MSLLKTKLTFEQLCPVWSRRLKIGDTEDGRLGLHSECVVGEAWKWKADDDNVIETESYFGCKECYRHSVEIYEDPSNAEHFVDHWNNAHV